MHEMSLCEGILQLLEAEAANQKFSKVKKVWLEIGDLAAVEVDALRFSYDVVVANSIAADSELIIEHVPGQAWCMPCAKTVTVTARHDSCSDCGSYQLQVTQGDEMRVKELEVE